ncbi:MAG TPA: amino acid adenylation domain-containing protein [Conexibacter sp.]|nr:amino acid adenylation domain-containing protein [Conexibacter sp.]
MPELLQDFAARAADAHADSVALAMDDERIAYGELVQLSDRLAAQLVAAGCRRGDRVCLLIPKQPLAIVAMHAILKAGAIYVPLDSESPAPRLARIVDSAAPSLLLAAPETSPLLDELAGTLTLPPIVSTAAAPVAGERVRSIATRAEWDRQSAAPAVRVGADDGAYLLFTSGSTGVPKGVLITHRNVAAFTNWTVAQFGVGPDERISGHPALHFDLSTLDVWTALAAGAELVMVPPALGLNARGLAELIRTRELTQWCSVPSVLTYMAKFDAVGDGDFPALRRLLWCREVLPTPILSHWMRRLPHVRFTNLYGPTEATVASSWYDVPAVPEDESAPVPIGSACAGEELLVLDERRDAVAVEEIGDLYIGGVGLSPGYWRDEQKTRAAFVPDPRDASGRARLYRTGDLARVDADGRFHFLGRADSQIKSRGYRIELGEVESALSALAGVRECAVVGVEGESFEGVTIGAAYVGDDELRPAALRRELAAVLPSYMLPAHWISLDVLPKNQNGKIDRSELRERLGRTRTDRRGQRT